MVAPVMKKPRSRRGLVLGLNGVLWRLARLRQRLQWSDGLLRLALGGLCFQCGNRWREQALCNTAGLLGRGDAAADHVLIKVAQLSEGLYLQCLLHALIVREPGWA